MLRQKGSVTVGISGGADSVCLFLQLYKLKEKLGIELKAVTVEHGIRGDESEKDAEFSKKFCEERGIPCRIVHVDAPKRAAGKGISLEEAARQLRYEAFFENTDPGEAIALAHHLEDQAETTKENFQNIAALISKDEPVVMISSDYHMDRAVRIAQQEGFPQVMRLPAPSSFFAYGANMMSEVVLDLNDLTK